MTCDDEQKDKQESVEQEIAGSDVMAGQNEEDVQKVSKVHLLVVSLASFST